MNYKKIVQKEIPQISRELFEFTNDSLLCELLSLRGIKSKDDANEFLDSENTKLATLDVFCDCEKVINRIKKAITLNEKILIWGDFDADGVTSSALLYKTMKTLEANFEVFIPDREKHGHGINTKKALELISKHKIKLIITVDCGISNAAEIKLIKSLGVDVIVTDHHKLEGQTPDAFAILNPQAPSSLREDLDIRQIENLCRLAGVGVAYKLALKLLNLEFDENLLVLACVGTISDVVPLLGENRTIVTKGLKLINKKVHKGISMLFERCGRENITSNDIAFVLTPRINAVGRLSSPDLAFEFLTSENESTLNFIIDKLDNFNKIRQSLCENIYLEATQQLKEEQSKDAIILYNKDWHLGIIGIVASKIVEDYSKPVFMITSDDDNIGRCSIRSTKGFNVYDILKNNSDLFLGYGGHALAGGFSFDINLHSFEKIKQAILNTIEEITPAEVVQDYVEVEKKIDTKDIKKGIISKINLLEPFGQDNPTPLFGLKNALLKDFKIIGKNSNHLKFYCQKDGLTFECVKWNESSFEIPLNSTLDIAFSPKINFFNNEENIQLEVFSAYSENLAKLCSNDEIKIYDHRKKDGILDQICEYLKNKNLDITIWAKNITTLEKLKKYPEINNKLCNQNRKHNTIMFFDYPSNIDEFKDVLKSVQPKKIHLMKDKYNEDIDQCLKMLSGMLKYSHNHLNGQIEILRLANACGVSETFIQLALEIFEQLDAIEILDVDKIKYIKPVNLNKIKTQTLYELLQNEFFKIIEFKKHLAESELDKMYGFVQNCLE